MKSYITMDAEDKVPDTVEKPMTFLFKPQYLSPNGNRINGYFDHYIKQLQNPTSTQFKPLYSTKQVMTNYLKCHQTTLGVEFSHRTTFQITNRGIVDDASPDEDYLPPKPQPIHLIKNLILN